VIRLSIRAAISPDTRRAVLPGMFRTEAGAELPRVEIAYRTWGRLSPRADNAVVVCHALTGSADADEWWAPMFGPGRALDPASDFIVCSNVLGGCYGSTGPTSLAPDGSPWGPRFPPISIRDQVRAQSALADLLGIRSIRCVLGGSMGGLQALEWALVDPERVRAVATVAASGRHGAWCLLWSEAQRLALRTDPAFRGGDYPLSDPPLAGLAAARAIAMISYRSSESIEPRFGRRLDDHGPGDDGRTGDFAARAWLRHHGRALVERFDANTYLTLIDAMDTHDLGRGRGDFVEALGRIRIPVLVASIPTDVLYRPVEQQALAALLPDAELVSIESGHGHDGFLIDAETIEPVVRRFREQVGRRRFAAAV
jgi:homoserine O-acetyltransferase